MPDALFNLRFGYDAHQLRAYGDARAKEARAEALTAAAAECERVSTEYRDAYKGRGDTIDRSRLYNLYMDGCSDGAFESAEAVRALMKEPQA
jgi:hypothetical protein